MGYFDLLLVCYRSGQMSARQWYEHLKDADFAAWVEALSDGQKGA